MAALFAPDGTVKLDRSAEEALRLEAERVGGLAVDRDQAVRHSTAANFWMGVQGILEDVDALSGKRVVA